MASQPDDEGEIIIVVGERVAKPTAEVRLNISPGGTGGLPDSPLLRFFRSLLQNRTEFDLDRNFTPAQKKLIKKIVQAIANHPDFAAAFENLMEKHVDINISPATRPEHLEDDALGQIFGLDNDGYVVPSSSLDIFIAMTYGGEPRHIFQIAITIVHELIHALGVPAFTARLDAPGSDWDRLLTIDLLKDFDFGFTTPQGGGSANVIGDPQTRGVLSGSVSNEVFVGSNAGNIYQPVGGGHIFYPGTGANEYLIDQNAGLSTVKNQGGSHLFALSANVTLTDVVVASTPDNRKMTLVVFDNPSIVVDDPAASGASYSIRLGTIIHPISAFATRIGESLQNTSVHVDVFGVFVCGYIGSAAISDLHSTNIFYRLGSVTGAYAGENWSIDESTGAISGQFHKPDLGGSEFSIVTALAGNGTDTAEVHITVRWAHSGEMNPEL